MNYTQFFETTIYSRSSNHAITFVTFPKRSFDKVYQAELEKSKADWLDYLPPFDVGFYHGLIFSDGYDEHSAYRWIELVPFLFAAVMQYKDGNEAIEVIAQIKNDINNKGFLSNPESYFSAEILSFSKELSQGAVIPFEQSPISLVEFSGLIKGHTGRGIGATMGFYVGQANPPLLFLTVPAGMLIGMATDLFIEELSPWLRPKIKKLLGVLP